MEKEIVVVQRNYLPKLQFEFFNHVTQQITAGEWIQSSQFYHPGENDRQKTANWFSKHCNNREGEVEYLLLKKIGNVFSFKKEE